MCEQFHRTLKFPVADQSFFSFLRRLVWLILLGLPAYYGQASCVHGACCFRPQKPSHALFNRSLSSFL